MIRTAAVPAIATAIGLLLIAAAPARATAPSEATAPAGVKLSALVGEHMVVQRGRPVRLSGSAAPGEAISATLGTSRGTTNADARGRWLLALPALPAGGPYQLTVEGAGVQSAGVAASRLSFGDVWVGEVWIASGQSNMELPLVRTKGVGDGAAGGCPGLRLFMVSHDTSAAPKADAAGSWQTCDAETAEGFSAAAFYFGREIDRALGVPVGLIQATWGGTPAEAWTPREALAAEPSTRAALEAFDRVANDANARARLAGEVAAWEAKSFHQDTGNKGQALGYARPGFSDRAWAKMAVPQIWENAGLPIDGAVWFRREITVPAAWAAGGGGDLALSLGGGDLALSLGAGDLALSLGAIDDFDVTYWNGERVGATGGETKEYWATPRHYVVPARLVKAGRNVIAVRVFDHYGNGGFAGTSSQMSVGPARPDAPSLPLAGTWSYKIERRLPPISVDWGTRPTARGVDDPTSPSVLWNGMVAAVAGTPAAGVIWYQGEANVGRAAQYRALFPAMIRAWRGAWRDPALPFLFVQLPGFAGDAGAASPLPFGDSPWAELREAQAAALGLAKTAMAAALDIGEPHDIHPRNKQEVGRRLALAALRAVYGQPHVIAAGPTFAGVARDGHALRVRFTPDSGGLITADGAPPKGFIVAGADHVWRRADARIDGLSLIVSSPDVPEPVAVRYGWGDDPENTLRNQADLPAIPFRSDDWAPASAPTASAASP